MTAKKKSTGAPSARIITEPIGRFVIEEKRFYVPGVKAFAATCPRCGKLTSHQFDYLNYPEVDHPFPYSLCCGACEHEWDVRLRLTVHLEVAS